MGSDCISSWSLLIFLLFIWLTGFYIFGSNLKRDTMYVMLRFYFALNVG